MNNNNPVGNESVFSKLQTDIGTVEMRFQKDAYWHDLNTTTGHITEREGLDYALHWIKSKFVNVNTEIRKEASLDVLKTKVVKFYVNKIKLQQAISTGLKGELLGQAVNVLQKKADAKDVSAHIASFAESYGLIQKVEALEGTVSKPDVSTHNLQEKLNRINDIRQEFNQVKKRQLPTAGWQVVLKASNKTELVHAETMDLYLKALIKNRDLLTLDNFSENLQSFTDKVKSSERVLSERVDDFSVIEGNRLPEIKRIYENSLALTSQMQINTQYFVAFSEEINQLREKINRNPTEETALDVLIQLKGMGSVEQFKERSEELKKMVQWQAQTILAKSWGENYDRTFEALNKYDFSAPNRFAIANLCKELKAFQKFHEKTAIHLPHLENQTTRILAVGQVKLKATMETQMAKLETNIQAIHDEDSLTKQHELLLSHAGSIDDLDSIADSYETFLPKEDTQAFRAQLQNKTTELHSKSFSMIHEELTWISTKISQAIPDSTSRTQDQLQKEKAELKAAGGEILELEKRLKRIHSKVKFQEIDISTLKQEINNIRNGIAIEFSIISYNQKYLKQEAMFKEAAESGKADRMQNAIQEAQEFPEPTQQMKDGLNSNCVAITQMLEGNIKKARSILLFMLNQDVDRLASKFNETSTSLDSSAFATRMQRFVPELSDYKSTLGTENITKFEEVIVKARGVARDARQAVHISGYKQEVNQLKENIINASDSGDRVKWISALNEALLIAYPKYAVKPEFQAETEGLRLSIAGSESLLRASWGRDLKVLEDEFTGLRDNIQYGASQSQNLKEFINEAQSQYNKIHKEIQLLSNGAVKDNLNIEYKALKLIEKAVDLFIKQSHTEAEKIAMELEKVPSAGSLSDEKFDKESKLLQSSSLRIKVLLEISSKLTSTIPGAKALEGLKEHTRAEKVQLKELNTVIKQKELGLQIANMQHRFEEMASSKLIEKKELKRVIEQAVADLSTLDKIFSNPQTAQFLTEELRSNAQVLQQKLLKLRITKKAEKLLLDAHDNVMGNKKLGDSEKSETLKAKQEQILSWKQEQFKKYGIVEERERPGMMRSVASPFLSLFYRR